MQLFHIEPNNIRVKWDNIEVFSVPELISQLCKVLRVKKWDKICVQFSDNKWTTRYELSIQNRTDQDLTGEIISTQTFSFHERNISMLIAMPNKREKAELIVQKLTEIWASNICFWTSEHSIIRQRNKKKEERLNKVLKEAVEQSWGTWLPTIRFLYSDDELINFINWKKTIIANIWWLTYWKVLNHIEADTCWVVWPEWWLSEKDLKLFNNADIIDLWTNVLRMETASIILAWLLKNI